MIDFLIEICKKCHVEILDIYNNPNMWLEEKPDNSPLTEADIASNKIICEMLNEQYPNIPIISEENKAVDYEVRKNYDTYWLIDPLDGTKEFIKRNGEFTVNIALIKNGSPIVGVVSIPCKQMVYYATKNYGAFKMDLATGEKTSLETRKNNGNLTIVCSKSHLNKETTDFLEKFSNYETVSVGSSIKFLLVAEGSADIYPRIAPTMEWDTAAAQIIVEEAGGKVLQFDSKEPVIYNKENLLNPYFVVYG